MIIEQLFFIVISLAIFVYMLFKMLRKNDTVYIVILAMQAIGIAINLIETIFSLQFHIVVMILEYLLAIFIPVFVIILEKKGISLSEKIKIYLAEIYFKNENTKKAKQILLDLLEKHPENYMAHKLLAGVYEKEGGMRKAIDEYVKAIDINKKDYDSYFTVANLLTQLDKKEEAAEMLYNLLNVKPDKLEATELLGEILIENEMYKEAVNIYQTALRFNPLSYNVNYNLGIAYTMLNDFQNAKVCYEKAAEINALSFISKYSLAEIALINKDLEEAERKFLETTDDEELSPHAYYELAKIYLTKNEKDIAIQYVNTAIDLDAKRIVEKVKKDPLFIPILARISIPFNLENHDEEHLDEKEDKEDKEDNIKQEIGEKEIKLIDHLEEMSEIARNLSYNDIMLLRKNTTEGTEVKEQEELQEEIDENIKIRE